MAEWPGRDYLYADRGANLVQKCEFGVFRRDMFTFTKCPIWSFSLGCGGEIKYFLGVIIVAAEEKPREGGGSLRFRPRQFPTQVVFNFFLPQ
jgi:hypothetical protein